MVRLSETVKKNQDLEELARLLNNAIERDGRSKAEIARVCKLSRSHLSYVLSAEKTFGRENLVKLGQELGLDSKQLLRVAGHLNFDPWLKDISAAELFEVVTSLEQAGLKREAFLSWISDEEAILVIVQSANTMYERRVTDK